MFIEFYWSKKLNSFIILFFLSIIANIFFSLFRNKNTDDDTILFYELIPECSLFFSIIFFFIQKLNMNHLLISKFSNINEIVFKNHTKNIKFYKIIFFFPKTTEKFIQFKLFFLIILTSIIKFFYTLFYNYFSTEKFIHGFKPEIKLCYCAFYIFSIISILIFSKFLFKRKFYRHHLFAITLMSIISAFLFFINYGIINMKNKIEIKQLIIIGILNIILNFLIGIMYVFYKYLMEIHFISLHVINFYEGILITIYLILFYFLHYKKNDSFKKINYLYLFINCIIQIATNFLLKYIIYTLNDMYAIIPSYLTIFLQIISNLYINEEDKKNIGNLFNYYCLCLSELIMYLLIIFFAAVFIEVIIIKLYKLEEKTLKYLKIKENVLMLDDINLNLTEI